MGEYLLETNAITKMYGKHKAVDAVSMHIEKGSVYGFIGRNGAGKTTFMKIICGLAAQTSGEVSVFGCTGAQLNKVRRRIGCLIEAPGLYPDMTAYQNLKAKCLGMGVFSDSYVKELLELVGLSDAGKKNAKNFSLGMKQRLGIAMTLIGDPEFLVLDEPINGLDPQGIVEVRDVIHRLATERNKTILISSHILDELDRIATHFGIINNGVLIKELSSKELHDECAERLEIKADDVVGASKVLDDLGITKYQITDDGRILVGERAADSAVINRSLVTSGIEVSELAIRGEALEEYYIRLTGGADNA